MLVIGDKEVADGAVAVRSRSAGDQGSRAVAAFIDEALAEIKTKGAVAEATA
jgi:threonyl-tRNA synthetase